MLWKLELACADAQAEARGGGGGCAPAARVLMRACAARPPQKLAEMQATAAERSLPPPGYADKARAHAAVPACATPRDADAARAQVALAGNTACLSRDAAFAAMRTVSSRPAAIAGARAHVVQARMHQPRRLTRGRAAPQRCTRFGWRSASARASPRCAACSRPPP